MTKYYRENYPRPQFVRDSYLDLNGEWNFRFDDKDEGFTAGWADGFEDRKILVPFSFECKASGIGCIESHEIIWYSREIDFSPLSKSGGRILLNVEGADYETKLWVNGTFIGSHRGGYTRFSFDITDALADGAGAVVFRISDSLSAAQPRGKQRWLRESYDCWYVQTTGIWKSLWAEEVGDSCLDRLHIKPCFDDNAVDFEYNLNRRKTDRKTDVETVITFQDNMILSIRETITRSCFSRRYSLECDNMKLKVKYWSPESPDLYDVCVRVYENGVLTDKVGSYFGLRKISTDSMRIKLNNTDLYLKMILDQGYWENTALTPPDEHAIIDDIDKILSYGYNGVRKHQKIEDERFYYWADVKGLLVWCEAPSFYELIDTAIENMTAEWTQIVRQHYNHPSIIAWVPFNESWGIPHVMDDKKAQNLTESVYYLTKALDDSRPVVSNDGWEHTRSDIITLHDYAPHGTQLRLNWKDPEGFLANSRAFNGERYAFANGFRYEGQPVILSEFGGIAYGKDEDGWGYGEAENSEEAFLNRLKGLMDAVYDIDHICGFCYTQLTDVEQEQNGHMFMDRRDKIAPKKVRAIIAGGPENIL